MLAVVTSDKTYINNILETLSYKKGNSPSSSEIYNCKYNEHDFLIAVTGYGKVNIASTLRYICDKYPIKVILCVGTAGSIIDSNNIFTAVIPTSTLQFDVDFTPNGFKPAYVPKVDKCLYNTNNDLIECLQNICNLCGINYSCDIIATSDMFVNNYTLANNVRKQFKAGAVDCESGNVGQFSYMNGIPYACIKIISNYANNNGIMQYNLYDAEASILLQKIVNNFLKEFYEA